MVSGCHNSCDTGNFPGVLCQPAGKRRQEDQQQPSSHSMHHYQ